MKHNITQLLISLDQFMYCFIGTILSLFNNNIQVYADMTISAQAYRLSQRGYWYGRALQKVINCLFFDSEHCKKSYESEINNKHLPDDVK